MAEGPTGLAQNQTWATESGALVAQVRGSGARDQGPTNIWECADAPPSTKRSSGIRPEPFCAVPHAEPDSPSTISAVPLITSEDIDTAAPPPAHPNVH